VTLLRQGYARHDLVVRGGRLSVHEWNVGSAVDADPLVLLHGFTGSGRSWAQAVALLSYPGRVLAPDLPGHGHSCFDQGERACTVDVFAAALDDALDALGASRVVLAGYSMGGRVALHYAITRQPRLSRLVLESASAGIATSEERESRVRADEELASYVLAEGMERFVDCWERTPVLDGLTRLPAVERARLRELRLANAPEGLAASLHGMGTGAQAYLGSRLEEIAIPTLVIAGAEDAKFSAIAEALAAGIPKSTLAILPNVGHTPHLEAPAQWAEVVGSFIKAGQRAG
jgi:2-succinyl-6-hydroxy-2,4-cyclohexadiene-1-carboxylate synthase